MKPLLIIPPAPARWQSLQGLLGHKGPLWLEDIQKRLHDGVAESRDAFAVVANGGQTLAHACINGREGVGVLGHMFTRADHRGRGLARKVLTTLLSWFDMSGGQWLFLGCHAELLELYGRFGFEPLHRVTRAPIDEVTMCRRSKGAAGVGPLYGAAGPVIVRDVTRADWPLLVALQQYQPGFDPRIAADESAVAAEFSMLELLHQQEAGQTLLLAAWQGPRIAALATLATQHPGPRTYAALLPHNGAPAELRETLLKEARTRGYPQVEFPMEALAGAGGEV